ncbi:MAG: flagellar basal body rod protein FlgC [Anaerolineae bacterium]|nr:flagellar basal body rod protein FlgC [Anaerolineae bacterium]
MSGIFSAFRITASALTSQRLRMDVTANNVANAETTRTEEGGPYQRQQVVFEAMLDGPNFIPTSFSINNSKPGKGVNVTEIVADDSPGNRVYDPNHPDADDEGFVTYPNVNIVTEMTDMLSATRSYEANVTVFNSLKNMAMRALDIGRS